jgi:hypothetical protein
MDSDLFYSCTTTYHRFDYYPNKEQQRTIDLIIIQTKLDPEVSCRHSAHGRNAILGKHGMLTAKKTRMHRHPKPILKNLNDFISTVAQRQRKEDGHASVPETGNGSSGHMCLHDGSS